MTKRFISYQTRMEVLRRYGVKPGIETFVPCHYCSRPGRIYWMPRKDGKGSTCFRVAHEFDHVRAEFNGGDDSADNLVLACRRCNRSKGTRDAPNRWAIEGRTMNASGAPLDRQMIPSADALNPIAATATPQLLVFEGLTDGI